VIILIDILEGIWYHLISTPDLNVKKSYK
jgi:hypothetical protein